MVTVAIMSDLHVEFERNGRGPDRPTKAWLDMRARRKALTAEGHPRVGPLLDEIAGQVDLVLLAGDIGVGAEESVRYAALVRHYVRAPVVLVPGNHEYYGCNLPYELAQMERLGAEMNVAVLDQRAADFAISGQKICVLGATLWTDYRLFERDGVDLQAVSMAVADGELNDHRRIGYGQRRFTPQDALDRHVWACGWLASECEAGRREADRVIVVTHHAPTPLGNAPQYRGSRLAPAFVSNMEAEIRAWSPELWVSGHTHHSIDVMIGHTRMVAAQRGYVGIEAGADVFRPLVVEV